MSKAVATVAAPMSIFDVSVIYATETTSWDTYSAFTVLAPTEAEAHKAIMITIGEFHAPLTLRTDNVRAVPTEARILRSVPLAS